MMHPVKSKLIEGASYDQITRVLTLHLTTGQRREYVDVPSGVLDELVGARSPGSYYTQEIKPKFTLTDG